MKKSVMMTLLAILATMVCWSCKDDKDEQLNRNQDGPMLVDGKVVFSRGDVDAVMPYDPVDFDDLPQFVRDELMSIKTSPRLHIMDFVYEGYWKGQHAYVVDSDDLVLSNVLMAGYLYLADGTFVDVLTFGEFVDNVDLENEWKCIFYWRPLFGLPDDFDMDTDEYLMSLELYRKLMGLE